MGQINKSNKNKQTKPAQQQPQVKKNVKGAVQKKKQKSGTKSGGCCKWVLGSLFITATIVAVLVYDTQVNGKGIFEKSASGKALKNAGLLPYAEKAWFTTMGASARGYKWAEQHVPPYAGPIVQLSCDLFKLAKNALCNAICAASELIRAKLPVAANFVEQYLPGFPQLVENTSNSVKNITVETYGKIVTIFQTQVLVGRLSPENLGKALNDTQNVALEYYKIFHKKVDAYAKLK